MPDYSELMLQAMEIMAKGQINNINYDTTKTYNIKALPTEGNGNYLVTDGSITFTAYSDASYRIGETVYVQIPEGDFNNQKNIIGRKVIASNEPYNYIRPLDQIIYNKNSILNNNQIYGLKINKDYKENIPLEEKNYNRVDIYNWTDEENDDIEVRGYDKLVISVDILPKTLFKEEICAS